MARAGHQELVESVKKEYGVSVVYSYSQVKSFLDDPYEYFLHYVTNTPYDIDTNSPYELLGGAAHDILENYYKGVYKKEECSTLFQNQFKELMTKPTTMPFSPNRQVNRMKADAFQLDISNYMNNMSILPGSNLTEYPFYCKLTELDHVAAFVGYIDLLNVQDKKFTIIDYKTSTFYKEEDIPKYKTQLLLYAYAIRTSYNLEYEDITVGWNFLKYAKVINKTDNSEQIIERCQLRDYSDKDYLIEDCIVTIDYNEKSEAEFVKDMLANIKQIEDNLKVYTETGDDSPYMWSVSQADLFRLTTFCKYSPKLHKPYKNYLDTRKNTV